MDGPTWKSRTDGCKFFGVQDPKQRRPTSIRAQIQEAVETEFLIEVCEGPGPCSHSGRTGTSARGHVRSSTRQSFEFGGSNRDHGRVPGSRSSISQGALARARVAAAPPAVDVQLTQCQPLIDRATKRIKDLDRARKTESIRLKEAQGRLHRLQQEVAALASAVQGSVNSGTNHIGAEVTMMKAKLAKSEAEWDALRAPRSKVRRTEDAEGC